MNKFQRILLFLFLVLAGIGMEFELGSLSQQEFSQVALLSDLQKDLRFLFLFCGQPCLEVLLLLAGSVFQGTASLTISIVISFRMLVPLINGQML